MNTTSQDAPQLFPGFIYEAVLRTALDDPSFSLKFRSTPFPPSFTFFLETTQFTQFYVVIFMGAALGVYFATVVSTCVCERISGLKHLQLVSGMTLKAYWTAMFLTDLLKYLVLVTLMALSFRYLDNGFFSDSVWIVLVSPLSFLPFTYCTSFLFSTDSGAQTSTIFWYIFVNGIVAGLITFLRLSPGAENTGDFLDQAMKVFPSYLIASTMSCDVSCKELSLERAGSRLSQGRELEGDKWHWTHLPLDIVLTFVHSLVWTVVLILIETRQQRAPSPTMSDLTSKQGEAIEVRNFNKVYWQLGKSLCKKEAFEAVNNLSFTVKTGECFALLGVNGAGKSTTFRSLTNEVSVTEGAIKIHSYDVQSQFAQARRFIGYCP